MRMPFAYLLAGLSFTVSSWPADMNQMDHGPFVSWTLRGETVSHKAIVIEVDSELPAMISFDTDLMRVSEAWTGGRLQWYRERDGLEKNPTPQGTLHFANGVGPGWTPSESYQDPRALPYGPLEDGIAHYRGLYLHGKKAVLSYTVGSCAVLEMPSFTKISNQPVFVRTFELGPRSHPMTLRVLRLAGGFERTLQERAADGSRIEGLSSTNRHRFIGFKGLHDSGEVQVIDGHLWLKIPAQANPMRFSLFVGPEFEGNLNAEAKTFLSGLFRSQAPHSLAPFLQPGPAQWLPVLTTQAAAGSEEGALAVDTLAVPEKNPWNSWIRCTGFDFLPDGRVVMASVSGDVWLVSGIREELGELKWKRFATGLYQPLGVKVVDGQIFVTGRDQITRLHDRNGDDEADYYENFNNDTQVQENFHEYTMNLETDSKGDFFFSKGAPWPPLVKTEHAGVLFRLSKDGKQLERYATGLRGPNGLTIGPNDLITFSDNEGHWYPTCVLFWIKKNGFYGMKPTAHSEKVPEDFEKPICWIPHNIDNSPGGQVWVPEKQWGPLAGQLLLTSYGKSTLSLVLLEKAGEYLQGGVVRIPLRFESGMIRGRFHTDGHLYLCGLRVWQSTGLRYGAFHRVRYTGKTMHLPVGMKVQANGIQLTFSCELDPQYCTDPQDYNLEQWNYRWIERYGSPHYSLKNPNQEGHDDVPLRAVRLLEDKKTIFLEIGQVVPVMQMKIAYNIRAADGTELSHEIYSTIHAVP